MTPAWACEGSRRHTNVRTRACARESARLRVERPEPDLCATSPHQAARPAPGATRRSAVSESPDPSPPQLSLGLAYPSRSRFKQTIARRRRSPPRSALPPKPHPIPGTVRRRRGSVSQCFGATASVRARARALDRFVSSKWRKSGSVGRSLALMTCECFQDQISRSVRVRRCNAATCGSRLQESHHVLEEAWVVILFKKPAGSNIKMYTKEAQKARGYSQNDTCHRKMLDSVCV